MRRLFTLAAAAAIAAGAVTALSLPSSAGQSPAADPAAEATADGTTAGEAAMIDAVGRDLGLTSAEARARLAAVVPAGRTEAALRDRLGAAFGGAWLAGDGVLTVGVTDRTAAAVVRAAGARPVVVANGKARLDGVKAQLDRHAERAPASVHGWYVDLSSNTVVVRTQPGTTAAATEFVKASGADRATVRVAVSDHAPSPLATYYNVRGGEALHTPLGRCSIGFSVVGGYVTAGHCGTAGDLVHGYNLDTQGVIQGSSFPVNDYGWVATNVIWVPQGVVYNWSGSFQGVVPVDGAQVAPVGSPVCRSGSTTGWRCGTILATDQTVNYPQGTVFGLTSTSACGDLGDSGGSFLSGGQAQGVLSGGAGNCTNGGTTVFQPLDEILTQYGLTLITTSTPVGIHSLECDVFATSRPTYRCTVTYNGGAPPYTHRWTVNGRTFTAGASTSGACLASGYTVQVRVTDSQGVSATADTGFGCP